MNLEAILTFLDIAQTGSFSLAAERACVSQSTVSARIQAIESSLQVSLFRRSRGGVTLTPAGADFRHHALRISDAWRQARLQLALPPSYDSLFRLGVPFALHETLALDWVDWMRGQAANVAIQIDVGTSDALSDRVLMRSLDAAIMYLPQRRPGLEIETLLVEELVLVRHADMTDDWSKNFISIYWGEEFSDVLRSIVHHAPTSAISIGSSALGLKYILRFGGSAYLPTSLIEQPLREGRLQIVADMPRFSQSVFLVTAQQKADNEPDRLALDGLRTVAATMTAAADTKPLSPTA